MFFCWCVLASEGCRWLASNESLEWRSGRSLSESGALADKIFGVRELEVVSVRMQEAQDPLRFAKAQWHLYQGVGKLPPPPPGPGKIVLETVKSTSRGVLKPTPRAGEPWTDKERVVLVKSFLKGTHIGVIAGEHERTVGAVTSELRKIGFTDGQLYTTWTLRTPGPSARILQ